MANNRIEYTIGFKTDVSSLNNLKKELNEIKSMTLNDFKKINFQLDDHQARSQFMTLKNDAKFVGEALTKAYNPKIGVVNLEKFNTELKETNRKASELYQHFQSVNKGNAFYNTIKGSLMLNQQLKQTSNMLDSIGETLGNTIKWGISSRAMNEMASAVQGAFNYVKALDTSLNNIRIVTGKSADEMARFAVEANNAAQKLGSGTKAYVDAALIYAQQGLGDQEISARAQTTIKASNVTGQDAKAVSEQLTAVWNGFQIGAEGTEAAVDKLAAVASTTASNLEELSTGMSKVASAANAMGVDIDQLNAQLATVISVTRQAPETAGTAFKTIYARMSSIKSGEDEDGTTLQKYTKDMAAMGINILDQNNHIREMGEVIEEVGSKWSTMSKEQQLSLAQTMAGTRQYNNLLALFDNWDMYTKALETSSNAVGTLQKQQDIYMESTEAHLEQLNAATENFQDSLINTDSIKMLADFGKEVMNFLASFVDSIGGLKGVLLGLGGVLTQVFSKQIAQSFQILKTNQLAAKANAEALEQRLKNVGEALSNKGYGNEAIKEVSKKIRELGTNYTLLDEETRQYFDNTVSRYGDLIQQVDEFKDTVVRVQAAYSELTGREMSDDSAKALVTEEPVEEDAVAQSAQRIIALQRHYNSQININSISGGTKNFSTDNSKRNLEEIGTQLEKLKTKMGAFKNERLKIYEKEDIKKVEQASQLVEKIQKKISEGSSQDFTEDIKKLRNSLKDLNETEENATNSFNNLVAGLRRTKKGVEETDNEIVSLKQDLENMRKVGDFTKKWQNITSVIGALGSLGFAITSIQNLGSIWLDEDINSGEKILQTVTNLATVIPMVVTGIQAIRKVLNETSLAAATNGITAAILAVTAVVAIIATAVNAQEEMRKKTIEANKEKIKEIEENQNLIKSNQELAKSYDEVQSKYEKGLASKEDLYKVTDELCEKYEIENAAIYKLSGQYDLLTEKIKDARLEEAKRAKQEAENAITLAKANFSSQAAKDLYYWNLQGSISSSSLSEIELASIRESEKFTKDFLEDIEYTHYLDGSVAGVKFNLDDFDKKSAQEQTRIYEQIKEFEQLLLKNGVAYSDNLIQNMELFLKNNKDSYDAIVNNSKVVIDNIINKNALTSDLDLSKSQEEFNNNFEKFSDNVKTELENLGYKEQQITEYLDNYLNKIGTNYSIRYSAIKDLEKSFEGNEEILDFLKSLSNQDLALLLSVEFNGEETVDRLKLLLESSKARLSKEDTTIEINLREKIAGGKLKAEDIADYGPQFSNLLGSNFLKLDKLEQLNRVDQISQLKNITNANYWELLLGNEEDREATAEKFKAEADEIQNKINGMVEAFEEMSPGDFKFEDFYKISKENLDEANLEKRLEDYGITTDEFKKLEIVFEAKFKDYEALNSQVNGLTASAAALRKTIESLSETEIKLSSISESQNAIQSSIDKCNVLNEAIGMIGEGWIVAAKDVESFSKNFPELIKNYKILKDGSMKLDAESVNEYIRGNQEKIESDYEVQKAKIQMQLAILDAEDEYYTAQKETGEQLLTGEINQTEAKEKLESAFLTYKGKIQKLDLEGTESYLAAADTAWSKFTVATIENVNKLGNSISNLGKAMFAIISGEKPEDWVSTTLTKQVNLEDYKREYAQIGNEITEQQKKNIESLGDEGISAAIEMIKEATSKLDENAPLRNLLNSLMASLESSNNQITNGLNKLGSSAKDVLDIYHDINIELKKIEKELSIIQKMQEKLVGKDLLNNLAEQVKLYDKQVQKLREKESIQRGELKARRGKISGYAAFNADGDITNYAEMMRSARAGLADEEFEEFKKNVERYETVLYDELSSTQEAIYDAYNEAVSAQIEAFSLAIEIHLDLNDAKKEWAEFKRKVLDAVETDLFFKDDDILTNLKVTLDKVTIDKDSVTALADQLNAALAEGMKMNAGQASVYGNATDGYNWKQYYEDLQNYQQKLIESSNSLRENIIDAKESYLNMLDEASSKMDEINDRFENVNKTLDHYIRIVELMSRGNDSIDNEDSLITYYSQRQENINAQLKTVQDQKDYWERIKAGAREGSDEWLKANEEIQNATEKTFELIEDGMENAAKKFENEVSKVFKDLEREMSGGSTLNQISTEWDTLQKISGKFYDDVEKAYKIRSLEAKTVEKINKLDSDSAKTKVNSVLQEQLGILKNKDEFGEYEVSRAEKILDITMKQIALEEAQQNKSQMRLRRDSQGNYSYQFVADTEDIEKKQQELDDAKFNLYEFDKEQLNKNVNETLDLYTWLEGQIKEAAAQGNQERINYLKDVVAPQLDKMAKQNKDMVTNYSDDATDAMVTKTKEELNPTLESIGEKFITNTENADGFKTAFDNIAATIVEKDKELNSDIEKLGTNANTNLDKISGGYGDVRDEITKILTESGKLITKYDNLNTKIKDLISTLIDTNGLTDAFKEVFKEAEKAATKAQTAIEKQNNLQREIIDTATMGNNLGLTNVDLEDFTLNTKGGSSNGGSGGTQNKETNNLSKIVPTQDRTVTGFKYSATGQKEAAELDLKVPTKPSGMPESDWNKIKLQQFEQKNGIQGTRDINGQKYVVITDENSNSGVSYYKYEDIYDTEKKITTGGTTSTPTKPAGMPESEWQKYKNVKDPIPYVNTNPFVEKGYKKDSYNKLNTKSGSEEFYDFVTGLLEKMSAEKVIDYAKYNEILLERVRNIVIWEYGVESATKETADKYYLNSPDYFEKERKKYLGFDTGGYTGDWAGTNGRLAMLHQKEIVLNAKDTKNLLNAVNTLRDLKLQLDNNYLKEQLENMIYKLQVETNVSELTSNINNTSKELQQKVEISANFPNVTNHNEIEQAFNNIVNMATQYAYTNKK